MRKATLTYSAILIPVVLSAVFFLGPMAANVAILLIAIAIFVGTVGLSRPERQDAPEVPRLVE